MNAAKPEPTARNGSRAITPRRSRRGLLGPACVFLCLCAFGAPAQDFGIDWWTVDGGGELFSETADQHWQLSGTVGQWDATDSMGLAGGGFTLIGGFWPATSTPGEALFGDGFED
jgi:hypothetical protein